MDDYEDLVARVEKDCPGFVGVSVVDLDSGMTLASRSGDASFDLATASAFNSEMVKQKRKVMEVLGLDMELEDMLLTLTGHLHLIKVLDETTFLYLAATRANNNLALVRNAVHKNL